MIKTFSSLNEGSKFTFKTEKPKGRWKSFDHDIYHIKLNKVEIGMFVTVGEVFRVRLRVMKTDKITDSNPNCPWKWIHLKGDFKTLQDGKDWVKRNTTGLLKKFDYPKD